MNSEIQLKQFLPANYKYIKLPCEELSEQLNQATDIDSKRRLINKEYMHWMESLETHREKTGADSCDRRPPNVIPTSGVRSDKNKIGNQVRQFRSAKIRPSKKELRRNEKNEKSNGKWFKGYSEKICPQELFRL